jgi:NADH dehydrogenase
MAQPATSTRVDVVTGAFSYTGRFIARRLLADGGRVRTLTNHTRRPGAEDLLEKLEVEPLQFEDRARLSIALRGASTLYNTYWVRFPHGRLDFEKAVANTQTLVRAAADAGVKRIVHISVSNPSLGSPLAYYAGKAKTEEVVKESGLSWGIVRPTLVFAGGDILINNIAWMLRRMPVFGIPGDGSYRVQPVSGEDVADIAVWAGAQTSDVTVDAAGPEIVTFAELIDQVAIAVNRRPRLFNISPARFILAGRLIGLATRDVVLTREEVEGLMDELLVSNEPPRGTRRFDDWLLANAGTVGLRYASELSRHFRKSN